MVNILVFCMCEGLCREVPVYLVSPYIMEHDSLFGLDDTTDDAILSVDRERMIVREWFLESMEPQVFMVGSLFEKFKNSFREVLYMVRKESILCLEVRCITNFPIHG